MYFEYFLENINKRKKMVKIFILKNVFFFK